MRRQCDRPQSEWHMKGAYSSGAPANLGHEQATKLFEPFNHLIAIETGRGDNFNQYRTTTTSEILTSP